MRDRHAPKENKANRSNKANKSTNKRSGTGLECTHPGQGWSASLLWPTETDPTRVPAAYEIVSLVPEMTIDPKLWLKDQSAPAPTTGLGPGTHLVIASQGILADGTRLQPTTTTRITPKEPCSVWAHRRCGRAMRVVHRRRDHPRRQPAEEQQLRRSRTLGALARNRSVPSADLGQAGLDEEFDKRRRQLGVNRELQRTLRGLVAGRLVSERFEHRPAVRQVAQVVLEGREACDELAILSKRWHAVGDALVRVRQQLSKRSSQRLEGGTPGLLDFREIRIDRIRRHRLILSRARCPSPK